MIKVTCCKCDIVFGMTDEIYHQRQKDGKEFTCTTGHVMVFSPPENDNLKEEIKRLQARSDRFQNQSSAWHVRYCQLLRSFTATKGVVTKLKMKLYPERYEK